MSSLAIIIPAYKAEYFHEALDSLAAQTVKNFVVYVGDDHSPFDLKSVADRYEGNLEIKFTRFDYNIGSENLVLQWARCVALSTQEEWIWLFSDDDIADPKAVENFFLVLEKSGRRFDVYRFNTCTIDSKGKIISHNPIGPSEESSEEMAYNLLLDRRGNAMPDHIFSRSVYDKNKGFVFTQYAQGADWATSILFSKEKGMCIIPDSKLYWRFSGVNISSVASNNTEKMLNGHIQFIKWVLLHFQYLKTGFYPVSYEMIKEAAAFNLKSVIIRHYKRLSGRNIIRVYFLLKRDFGLSALSVLRNIFLIKEGTSPGYHKIALLYSRSKSKLRSYVK